MRTGSWGSCHPLHVAPNIECFINTLLEAFFVLGPYLQIHWLLYDMLMSRMSMKAMNMKTRMMNLHLC